MNKYSGSSFEDFLAEEGILEEVTERALKRLMILRFGDVVQVLIQRETTLGEKTKSEKDYFKKARQMLS